MFSLTKSLTVCAVAASIMFAGGSAVFSQTVFDTSPEQAERIHTTAGESAKLLANVKLLEPGTLTMAMSPYLPPTGFYATDSATVIGANADLASLIAEKLGLKLKIVVVAWPDWSLALSSGKFDSFISDLTITEERKQKFDFSTYAQDVSGFFVDAKSPIKQVKEPKDIAGLRVVVDSGTPGEKVLLGWDKQNVAAGLRPAEFVYFDDPATAQLALTSGKVDVLFVTYSQGAYDVAVNGTTKLAGIISGNGQDQKALDGVAVYKGSGLADAMTAAVNELVTDGTYLATLKRWHIEGEALDAPAVTNPPGLVFN